jgi:hypothetical protein
VTATNLEVSQLFVTQHKDVAMLCQSAEPPAASAAATQLMLMQRLFRTAEVACPMLRSGDLVSLAYIHTKLRAEAPELRLPRKHFATPPGGHCKLASWKTSHTIQMADQAVSRRKPCLCAIPEDFSRGKCAALV